MNNKQSRTASSAKNRAALRRMVKKRRIARLRKLVGGTFFFVIFYALMMIFSALILLLAVSCRHRDPQPADAHVIVHSEKVNEKTGEIKLVENEVDISPIKDIARSERSAYVPVSAFEMLGADITPAGDPLISITINLNEVGEWATFMIDSDKVNVNGTDITLGAVNVIRDGELYIPLDFFENQLLGVTVTGEDGEYSVRKNGLEPVSFVNKPAAETPFINESDYFTDEPIKFRSDLSRYEQYMNPENHDDYLFLVNVNNLLSEDFVPHELRDVKYTKPDRAKQQMSLNAQMAADAMLMEAREYGFDNLWVTSAYRSYQTQSWLFDNEVELMREEYGDEYAEEKAKESVNPPGASEHQSGLTADIHTLSTASLKFAGTPAAKWLEENAQYFGFILRYPEDKTDITGIMYEPWHFRYVGRYHAMQITRMGMCLEEYVEYLENERAIRK
ncbi:MAG: hypothetical protein E7588_08630 [Ruminococcaceae bacterium]|nr:hypothetical protein [Oscillospiraceae bacterium]